MAEIELRKPPDPAKDEQECNRCGSYWPEEMIGYKDDDGSMVWICPECWSLI